MSRVRGKHTSPEIRVRKAARALDLKYKLHPKNLPGKPDLVFPDLKLALFVHGCFWHRHPGCPKATPPSSPFWREKFRINVARDARVTKELRKAGWRVRVIWECESKDAGRLARKIESIAPLERENVRRSSKKHRQ